VFGFLVFGSAKIYLRGYSVIEHLRPPYLEELPASLEVIPALQESTLLQDDALKGY